MVTTEFLIMSIVALVLFGWHVFLVMQLWPPKSYLFDKDSADSPKADHVERGLDDVKRDTSIHDVNSVAESSNTTIQSHQDAANLILDSLNQNFEDFSPQQHYKLLYLTKEHLDIVYGELEGTDTDAEHKVLEARNKTNSLLEVWDDRINEI